MRDIGQMRRSNESDGDVAGVNKDDNCRLCHVDGASVVDVDKHELSNPTGCDAFG